MKLRVSLFSFVYLKLWFFEFVLISTVVGDKSNSFDFCSSKKEVLIVKTFTKNCQRSVLPLSSLLKTFFEFCRSFKHCFTTAAEQVEHEVSMTAQFKR